MAIPDFQTLMRPLLMLLEDGQEWSARAIRDALAVQFELTVGELEERLPSGRDSTFRNRVGWALNHIYRAGLVDRPRRAIYRLNDRGRELLAAEPQRIDVRVLDQFSQETPDTDGGDHDTPPTGTAAPTGDLTVAGTPEERAEAAYRELRAALASDVLDRVREQTPDFFEKVVLDVLQAIGYGGLRQDAAERLGRSGDGGVDGVNGKQLAELMLDHDVGVTVATRYEIKSIDRDYFEVEDDGTAAAEPAVAPLTSSALERPQPTDAAY